MAIVILIMFAAIFAAFLAGILYACSEQFMKLMGIKSWFCYEPGCDFYAVSRSTQILRHAKETHEGVLHI